MGDWVGCLAVEAPDEEVAEPGGCAPVPEVLLLFDVAAGEHHCDVGESDEGEGDGWEGGGGDESEDEGRKGDSKTEEHLWSVIVARHAGEEGLGFVEPLLLLVKVVAGRDGGNLRFLLWGSFPGKGQDWLLGRLVDTTAQIPCNRQLASHRLSRACRLP